MAYIIRILRFIGYTVCAAVVTTLLASIISTQRVLRALADFDVSTSISDRLAMTAYDMQHFGSMYGIFVLIGFLVAFFVSHDLARRVPSLRIYFYIGAGMVSMLVMLMLMQKVFFGVPIVAGARDGLGLFLQMLAGGAGGFVFYWLIRRRLNAQTESQD